jgi:transcriptional regulator with XRE-family HTH domain
MTVQEPTPASETDIGASDAAQDETWYAADAATFGDRLTGAREMMGMSQPQLARKLGIRQSTLRKWEDDLSEPRANQLQMLSGILNVSLRWLLTAEGDGLSAPDVSQSRGDDMKALLHELRQIRSDISRSGERLAVLEKRLRRRLEDFG